MTTQVIELVHLCDDCHDDKTNDNIAATYAYPLLDCLDSAEPIGTASHVGYWSCWVCGMDELGNSHTYCATFID